MELRPRHPNFHQPTLFTILSNAATMSTSTHTFLTNPFNFTSSSDFRDIFLDTLSDVVWTATGTSSLSGRYEGKHEYITKVLQPLYGRLEASPRPEVEDMIVDGEWAVVQFRSKDTRGLNGTDISM
jgi:ketosteroid isomerase-like protein